MIICLASNNAHKKAELSDLCGSGGHTIIGPPEAGITDFEPAETGSSFAENALLKAEELYRLLRKRGAGFPVLADDSGLCVDALGGRPGIYSARYRGSPPVEGRELSGGERNALLLEEVNARSSVPETGRSARFVCAMVLLFDPLRFYLAQETMEGLLVEDIAASRGSGGFGYDPIMYLPETGKTAAELSAEEKNRLSHRGKAARAIIRLIGRG